MKKQWFLLLLPLLFAACSNDSADRVLRKGPAYRSDIQKEDLGRGLVAIHNGDGKVSVSWRYLEDDPIDVTFDLYRKSGNGQETKLNQKPIGESTFFTDNGVDVSVDNVYRVAVSGKTAEERGATYALTSARAAKPYIEIPIHPVPGYPDGAYAPNDVTVGDLDGDGEYEYVVKLETRTYDNSRSGICEDGNLIDAYKQDGTFMWRLDLGINIRQGAHYTQMILHDFDGDGKAELALKTSEGTKFGDGTVIGDTDGDGRTDYRDLDPQSRTYGMVLEGPEFLSVIDGETGKELARTDYISRGDKYEFGDADGNRVDRFISGAGYFDGKLPSILICRGYYARIVMEAWDWRNGKLTRRWRFDTMANDDEYLQYEKQGNHNLRIGDVDGDGFDEVVYGSCMIDHDGTGGYTTGLEHGDAMHMSDLLPWRPGLEVWQSHETNPLRAGSEMRDAATGELLWGIPSTTDVGRAMSADIDPHYPGWEAWTSATDGTYTADGRLVTEFKPSVNFAIWWDGDLNRELLDGGSAALTPEQEELAAQGLPVQRGRCMKISKWTGDGVEYFTLPGEGETAVNNGTKSNPAISADLFGDWREELMVRTSDNKSLRIYMTDIPTEYRFHTLMSDVVYRLSVLCENIAYNQPPEPGYYLGSDLGKFWTVRYVRNPNAAPAQAQQQGGPQRGQGQGQQGQGGPQGGQRGQFQPGQSQQRGQFQGGPQTGQQQAQRGGQQQQQQQQQSRGLAGRMQNTVEQLSNNIIVYSNISDKYTLDARLDYDSYEWTINGKVLGKDRKLVLRQADYGYDKPIQVKIKTTYKGEVFEGEGQVTFSSEEGRRGYWSDRDAYRNERRDF